MSAFYANKLWGHGRLRQLAFRTWCRIVGHTWGDPWDEPPIRSCTRRCGGMTR